MPAAKHIKKPYPKLTIQIAKTVFWFLVGVFLGLFLLISFALIIFQKIYNNKIYPGIYINGVHVGGKTESSAAAYFDEKNNEISQTTFTFHSNTDIATASAEALNAGYDSNLLAQQAYSLGRSTDFFTNASLVIQAYMNGINLPPAYTYNQEKVDELLSSMANKIDIQPVDALFTLQNGRASAFRPSSNGQELDREKLNQILSDKIPTLFDGKIQNPVAITLPTKTLLPKITTAEANNLGIIELIGTGTSLFQHSIPSRIFNVELAANRINGVLIPPGQEFSFAKAVGDVSSLTGYQQAYVIQNGKTVLGDGGGVCQVSTTLFRAALNAGLPITERHAHAYRVGYYEEDGPPGIDATVYVPSVDLKFKNDTGNSILIQTAIDPNTLRLTFYLYGTRDGREVTMTTPVITNQTPPPPDLYTDDPTLPKGVIKQVDFAAWGSDVSFHRTVKKNGKVIIDETYTSHYQPWQAAFLRGTG